MATQRWLNQASGLLREVAPLGLGCLKLNEGILTWSRRRTQPSSPRAQDRILRRLNRKERKERKDSGQKEHGLALAAGPVLRPGKLAHLELIGPEVDQQTVFETGGLQVTKT